MPPDDFLTAKNTPPKRNNASNAPPTPQASVTDTIASVNVVMVSTSWYALVVHVRMLSGVQYTLDTDNNTNPPWDYDSIH